MLTKLPRHPSAMLGQALVESILACSALSLMLLGASWLWKFGELGQQNDAAVRYATWERSAYSAEATEIFTLFNTDQNLGKDTFRNTYLTPTGQLAYDAGQANPLTSDQSRSWLTQAGQFIGFIAPAGGGGTSFKSLNTLAAQALNVTTTTAEATGAPTGFDPTGKTFTDLELDRNIMQTVSVTSPTDITDFITKYLTNRFGIVPAQTSPLDGTVKQQKLGSLTIISNSWGSPGIVAQRRTFIELNPLSPTNHLGNIINNGLYANAFQLLGGRAGFGGNYRVDKVGLNATSLSGITGVSSVNSPDDILSLLLPTNEYKESYGLTAGLTEPADYVSEACTPDVARDVRLTSYTQDPICPLGILRERTIGIFDNPARRFVPIPNGIGTTYPRGNVGSSTVAP